MKRQDYEGLNDAQARHARYFLGCLEHGRGHGYPEALGRAVAARDAAERHPLADGERRGVEEYLVRLPGEAEQERRGRPPGDGEIGVITAR